MQTPTPLSAKETLYCLKEEGKYTIEPQGCYQYAAKSFSFDVAKPKMLKFNPTKFLVEGSFEFAYEAAQAKKVEIAATFTDPETGDSTTEMVPLLPAGKDGQMRFQFYSPPDREVVLVPQRRSGAKKDLLFYPETLSVSVEQACLLDRKALSFKAIQGLILSGSVEPATADVTIRITDPKSGEVRASVFTREDGQYEVGPLYSHVDYEIEASKEGYNLVPIRGRKGHFRANQLASLTVRVLTEKGRPLQMASLSLSAGKGFRKSLYTNKDGVAKFTDLYPGGNERGGEQNTREYILQAMKKE